LYDCLRAHSAALCFADGDDLPQAGLVRTANWGYVRRRADNYSDELLRELHIQIESLWDDTYVFFMHDNTGIGPKLALRFMELAGLSLDITSASEQ
jgi:uncharacterized protein YecE (DUF72 family)